MLSQAINFYKPINSDPRLQSLNAFLELIVPNFLGYAEVYLKTDQLKNSHVRFGKLFWFFETLIIQHLQL